MLRCLAILAVAIAVQGRAVNISNTWVLPEEGFPVFYRYFRDRISWYEADAVCQFHHANLVTVDTTAQYDAVRAYLKELDISSAVWVGLIRSNPDGDFTWTDYRGLSGDGYWSSVPDTQIAPLCAAADPAADYRWNAQSCGGPMVASFICELPVPQWASGSDGCMVRGLPALTALYLPESASVQLTVDCGQTGVRRVQCTGNIKRELLLKELSCEGDGVISTQNLYELLIDTVTSASTELSSVDEDTSQETTTNEFSSTVTQETSTLLPITAFTESQPEQTKQVPFKFEKPKTQLDKTINKIPIEKVHRVNIIQNNNLQNNELSRVVHHINYINEDHLNRLEDEKHLQQKLLHDELARRGNIDEIFSQPDDHFIPPLVMAKAKLNDDMTVVSLREKHEQQLEESLKSKINPKKYNGFKHNVEDNPSLKTVIEGEQIEHVSEKALSVSSVTDTLKDKSDKILKHHSPKKYFDKYYDAKLKSYKLEKIGNTIYKDVVPATTNFQNIDATFKNEPIIDSTTLKSVLNNNALKSDGPNIELTVVLKDPSSLNDEVYKTSNANFEKTPDILPSQTVATTKTDVTSTKVQPENKNDHEVVKIVIPNNEDSTAPPTVFEVTTKIVKDKTDAPIKTSEIINETIIMSTSSVTTQKTLSSKSTPDEFTTKNSQLNITLDKAETKPGPTETISTIQPKALINSTNVQSTTEKLKPDNEGIVIIDQIDNTLSTESNPSSSSTTFRSPLLSSENEPLRIPARSKRIQQPMRRLMKFSPFRILG